MELDFEYKDSNKKTRPTRPGRVFNSRIFLYEWKKSSPENAKRFQKWLDNKGYSDHDFNQEVNDYCEWISEPPDFID